MKFDLKANHKITDMDRTVFVNTILWTILIIIGVISFIQVAIEKLPLLNALILTLITLYCLINVLCVRKYKICRIVIY
jgi:hypothetical protein